MEKRKQVWTRSSGKAQTSRYWRHRADSDCRCCWRD